MLPEIAAVLELTPNGWLAGRVDLENVSTTVGLHCDLDASVRRSGHEVRDRHAVQGDGVDRRSAGKGVAYHDVLRATTRIDIDLGGVLAACMDGGHVYRSLPETDVTSRDRALARGNLRNDRDHASPELGLNAQPLVDNRPGRSVVAPGLHEHGPAGPATVDVRALVWGREDLRHRTGLLVRRITRGRFGEHRLSQRVRVALLLTGSESPIVALADRLDRCRQPEDNLLACPGRATAATGVEQPEVERPRPAVAGILATVQRGRAMSAGSEPGNDLTVDHQLGLHRGLPDPVLLERLAVVFLQRVGVLLPSVVPPCVVELSAQFVRQIHRPVICRLVALVLRHVGQVVQAADEVDSVVELLRTHP